MSIECDALSSNAKVFSKLHATLRLRTFLTRIDFFFSVRRERRLEAIWTIENIWFARTQFKFACADWLEISCWTLRHFPRTNLKQKKLKLLTAVNFWAHNWANLTRSLGWKWRGIFSNLSLERTFFNFKRQVCHIYSEVLWTIQIFFEHRLIDILFLITDLVSVQIWESPLFVDSRRRLVPTSLVTGTDGLTTASSLWLSRELHTAVDSNSWRE